MNFNNICEFGPGDSLAIGLMYMIIYKSKYIGFDAHPYCDKKISFQACSDALTHLNKIDSIPALREFMNNNRFINYINIEELFLHIKNYILPKAKSVSDEDIIDALDKVQYFAPYDLRDHYSKYEFDFIFSQAVLEHCVNLDEIYKFQKSNLSNNGVAYNHIDFKSHGTSFRWNGQYGISNKVYKSLEKSNTFQWINRMPISHHESLIKGNDLNLFELIKFIHDEGISMNKVSKDMKPFIKDLDDLNTHSSIVMSCRNI